MARIRCHWETEILFQFKKEKRITITLSKFFNKRVRTLQFVAAAKDAEDEAASERNQIIDYFVRNHVTPWSYIKVYLFI